MPNKFSRSTTTGPDLHLKIHVNYFQLLLLAWRKSQKGETLFDVRKRSPLQLNDNSKFIAKKTNKDE